MNPTSHLPSRLIYPPPRSHPQKGDEGGAREKKKIKKEKKKKGEKLEREREKERKRENIFSLREKRKKREKNKILSFCFRFLLQCTTTHASALTCILLFLLFSNYHHMVELIY